MQEMSKEQMIYAFTDFLNTDISACSVCKKELIEFVAIKILNISVEIEKSESHLLIKEIGVLKE